jgi:hypothetical protein
MATTQTAVAPVFMLIMLCDTQFLIRTSNIAPERLALY